MAPNTSAELHKFISAAKEHGASDESLVGILENAGWPKAEILEVLGARYESLTGVAIPHGKRTATPAKDAFLYLLSFATLATWTISLGSICYSLIDDWIPDPLKSPYGISVSYQISTELAALIVTFPLYMLVMGVIVSGTRQAPDKLDSGVRKWLTYIALLIAASVMIGDVVTFLAYYLRGDVSSRFVAKVAVTLLLSSGVFWYYLGSLGEARKGPTRRANRDMLAAILATVAVILVVVLGFWKVHGPSAQRLVRADEKRSQSLSQLANEINLAYRAHNKQLPGEITDLQKKRFADPITGQPPQYSPKSSSSYSLCATFATNSPKEDVTGNFAFWTHSAGAKCFEFDAAEQVPPAPYSYY